MRTQTTVNGREVVAIWPKVGERYMKATAMMFTTAVRKSLLGKSQQKDLLSESSTDQRIKTTVNNTRQSCTAVFLDAIPESMAEEFRRGKLMLK